MSIKALVVFGEPDPSQTNPVYYESAVKLSDNLLGGNWTFVSTNWVRKVFSKRKSQGSDKKQDEATYKLLAANARTLAREGFDLIIAGVFPEQDDYFLVIGSLQELGAMTTSVWIKGCDNPFWMSAREMDRHYRFLSEHTNFKKDLVVDFNEYQGNMEKFEARTEYILQKLAKPLADRGII
jgi:hypothetical protein